MAKNKKIYLFLFLCVVILSFAGCLTLDTSSLKSSISKDPIIKAVRWAGRGAWHTVARLDERTKKNIW